MLSATCKAICISHGLHVKCENSINSVRTAEMCRVFSVKLFAISMLRLNSEIS